MDLATATRRRTHLDALIVRAAPHDTREALMADLSAIDPDHQTLEQRHLLSGDAAPRVDLSQARTDREQAERIIAIHRAWADQPAVQAVWAADAALRAAFAQLRQQMPDEAYTDALRAGVIPRISWV